ncbi:DUF2909 domain-containing protein [Pseudidiomarina tainanensis]|jgi:cytochrome b subunit of formate dehydrogenase|uniref:DUF2909 domain-containing protein n=1 Tax=Pseudidiomarina tainanensis TaxID=502365 RepID=A0ACD2HIF1_9GAMM|nr:DUF2909 domain-containing protein [Pseudidiomarina tainanensis]RZQ56012.1 DUF2909 domain-containing protein [Pseudidiomarina tainanensis]
MVITAKIILVLLMLFMVVNLFRALFAMLRNDPTKPSMTKYLGQRVLFSAIAIVLIVVLLASGVLVPNPRPY